VTAAPSYLDHDDDDLGLPQARPVPRPRHNAPPEQLPQLPPPVVDDAAAGNLPASSGGLDPLERGSAGRLPAPAAGPRPRIVKAPRPPLRVDVLALLLAAVVCVCVTVLALRGVDVPEVLQTIGYVSAGGAFGLATAGAGRRQ
jgi:hypothetical protein